MLLTLTFLLLPSRYVRMLDICLNFHFLVTAMQLLHFVFNLIFVRNNHYSMMFLGRRKAALYCFTFTGSVQERPERCQYIYIYIYIYMSTTWRTRSRYKIFRLYFGEIHSFAPDFISKGSFRPEEFFEILF